MIDCIPEDLPIKTNASFLQLLLIKYMVTLKKNVTKTNHHGIHCKEFFEKGFDIKSACSFHAWPLEFHGSEIYLFLIIHI